MLGAVETLFSFVTKSSIGVRDTLLRLTSCGSNSNNDVHAYLREL